MLFNLIFCHYSKSKVETRSVFIIIIIYILEAAVKMRFVS